MNAKLQEHYRRIQDAINLAEKGGFTIEARTCCCGEGLVIFPDGQHAFEEGGETMEFEV